jgi:DnaJ-class molecular chaperone
MTLLGQPFYDLPEELMALADRGHCQTCKGTGRTPDEKQLDGWKYWSTYWCPDCKGTGLISTLTPRQTVK